MTLTTRIQILEPADPEKVFGLARTFIGIPASQPFTVKPNEFIENATEIFSQPGGFSAALNVTVCPTGQPECRPERCLKAKFAEEDCFCDERYFLQIMLDTTYGAEPCCACTHRRVIRSLLPAAGCGQYRWQDEFTGEWFTELPDSLCDRHGGGL